MALNKIFESDQTKHRARVVASGTKSGDPRLVGGRPVVALTDRGDATRTETVAGVSVTRASGGASLNADQASVAFDGTFEFAVTGATTTTANDVEVFIISATNVLTLTEGTNVHFGWTDYPEGFRKEAGRAPVRIGA